MWVVYGITRKTNHVRLFCYTQTKERALEAMDQYATCIFLTKAPQWTPHNKDDLPMDDDHYETMNGYRLCYDKNAEDLDTLFLYKKDQETILRIFSIQYVDQYIDDVLQQPSQVVTQLIQDSLKNTPNLPPKTEGEEEEEEEEEEGNEFDSDED